MQCSSVPVLQVRAMLELAEKELEARVSETTPFKNMKRMLQQKNESLRDLRRRLGQYERLDDDAADSPSASGSATAQTRKAH